VEEIPVAEYVNDFESGFPSFAKLGFTETILPEVNTTGLQTIHPYDKSVNYFAVMQQPIIIGNAAEPLAFDEIVLVEPGDSPDSESEAFYDYVSVSATKDFGRTWVSLAKYDASDQAAWLSNFGNSEITPALIFPRRIEVGQHFDIGDTVYFRFDLVTDGGVEGWGWYVDNILYGTSVNTKEVVSPIAELELFPNPAKAQTTVTFKLEKAVQTQLAIYDVQGNLIYEENVGKLSTGLHQFPISLERLNAGNYFLQLTAGGAKTSAKFNKI